MLNLNNARFETTCVRPEQYPKQDIPEIAFAGRSNVGKSSIINTLLNRKSLARIGATPGKTREINFYNIDDKFFFVDLPGYGFANVSKQRKSDWGTMIEAYFKPRDKKRLIILLVDIRHKPSEDDIRMYEWITAYRMPHIVVAAKADKITRSQIPARLKEISEVLGLLPGIVLIPFSSETRHGLEELWHEVRSFTC